MNPNHRFSLPRLSAHSDCLKGWGHGFLVRWSGARAHPERSYDSTLDKTVRARSVIALLGWPGLSNASGVGGFFPCSAYHLAAAGVISG